MELHQVRYFLAVCKTLNFTRAAEDCHVTQPALSRAVQQLEAELGGELFRRERAHTHMTELGQSVYPSLLQCYHSSQDAKALAEAFHKKGHAPLHLALSPFLEMERLLPVIGEISAAFPHIEINVFRGPPHEIADKLKTGDAEIAISSPLGDEWERFEAKKLYEEQFGLLLNKTHPLSRRNGLEPQDLIDVRLLCRPHCMLTDILVKKLKEAGAQSVKRHEVPSIEDVAGMVKANLGVGFWPMSRKLDNDLALNQIHGMDMHVWVELFTVFGRKHSVPAATFIKLLRARDWSNGIMQSGESLH